MTARLDGMDALLAKLAAMPAKVKEAAKAANDKSAAQFAQKLHGTVPKDTHDLEDSIQIGAGKTELGASVSIGAGLGYARAVEFGHMDGETHVPQRPYFYPLLRNIQRSVRGRLNRAVNKAIKEGQITDGGDS